MLVLHFRMNPCSLLKTGAICEVYRHNIWTHNHLVCKWTLNNYLAKLFVYKLPSCGFRTDRPVVFYKNGVLRNFAKFTEKHLSQSPFLNKVAGPRPATLFKKGLWHRFSCGFCQISKNIFFYRTPLVPASVGSNRGFGVKKVPPYYSIENN